MRSRNEFLFQTILKIGEETILIRKNKDFTKCISENSNSNENVAVDLEQVKRVVHFGELFNVVQEAHVSIGHGAGKKTYDIVKMKYSNVSRDSCFLFRELCPCNVARRAPARPDDYTLIISDTLNSRGQVCMNAITCLY